MKKNTYTINTVELESLAISPDIPFLGDVATIKQIGEKLLITLNFYNRFLASDIEYLISSRYPSISVEVTEQTEAKKVQPNVAVKKNINNIIVILSSKNNAGKSATTVNLALAMAESGAKVGIIDANTNNPRQLTMLGISDLPDIINGKKMIPHTMYGIESNSIDYVLQNENNIISHESGMIDALKKLINDTLWGSTFVADKSKENPCLDYLFIELPPSTDDLVPSLIQTIPITGSVIITTPQDTELTDAKKSIHIFEKMQIDRLGFIENMSTHIDQKRKTEDSSLGHNSIGETAKEIDISLLGTIPLDITLQQSLDSSYPLMIAEPNHDISKRYRAIAQHIAIAIAHKPKNFSHTFFGTISIENS